MSNVPPLRARQATGLVPYPAILLEGDEKSGKSWAAAILSRSERVGRTLWIDLGEGSGDEYKAIPGTRMEPLIHDGTWADIYGQVRAAKAEAQRAADAGELPTVLVIDTMTDEWDGLKAWVDGLARERLIKQGKSITDGDEPVISNDLWNMATARHKKIMKECLTFPGIVVLIARGKETIAVDANGRPIPKVKDYKVEGQKALGSDSTVWVRMRRTGRPLVIGARSVHAGIRPGLDEPQEIMAKEADDRLLEWLVFDLLRCNPSTAHVRDLRHTTGGELTAEERGGGPAPQPRASSAGAATPPDAAVVERLSADVRAADSIDRLKTVWTSVVELEKSGELTGAGANHLGELVKARKVELGGADRQILTRLHTLLTKRGVTDKDERLLVVIRITGRNDIESTAALTRGEAEHVIRTVEDTGDDIDLLTGEQLPAGVDPAEYAQSDTGQTPAAGSGQAA